MIEPSRAQNGHDARYDFLFLVMTFLDPRSLTRTVQFSAYLAKEKVLAFVGDAVPRARH
jgi:hypothetical protein